ncbi:MAG: FAD-binding oxidoreductase [Candidatus Helarchaeota archaeon]
MDINKTELINDLIGLVGENNLVSNEEDLLIYKNSYSGIEETPFLVVRPSSSPQFKRLFFILRRYHIGSITPRGSGLGINLGAYSNDLIIDLTQLKTISKIDSRALLVTAQAGTLFEDIQQTLLKEGYRLSIAPLLNGTIGGFIASGGYGYGSYRFGSIINILRNTTLILSNGQVIETGSTRAPPYACGYNLNSLVCGSEGYFGIISEVTLEISPTSQSEANFLIPFDDTINLKLIFQKLNQLLSLTSVSLYKNLLNNDNDDANFLLLQLEGNTEIVKQDQLTIESLYKSTLLNDNKALWDTRLFAPTQLPEATMFLEAIVPLQNLSEFFQLWNKIHTTSFFGTLINSSSILLYTFFPKSVPANNKNEPIKDFYTKIGKLSVIPPTIGNIYKEFVSEFFPHLGIMTNLKLILDKNSRMKSRKLVF